MTSSSCGAAWLGAELLPQAGELVAAHHGAHGGPRLALDLAHQQELLDATVRAADTEVSTSADVAGCRGVPVLDDELALRLLFGLLRQRVEVDEQRVVAPARAPLGALDGALGLPGLEHDVQATAQEATVRLEPTVQVDPQAVDLGDLAGEPVALDRVENGECRQGELHVVEDRHAVVPLDDRIVARSARRKLCLGVQTVRVVFGDELVVALELTLPEVDRVQAADRGDAHLSLLGNVVTMDRFTTGDKTTIKWGFCQGLQIAFPVI